MIRTPEELLAFFEAERAETDALQAREEILQLLEQPGWKRVTAWLSDKRDHAFQQLRAVNGTSAVIAESFRKWQIVDAMYDDIQDFIRATVDDADDILRRKQTSLEEELLKEHVHGRSRDTDDLGGPGSTAAGDPRGSDPTDY